MKKDVSARGLRVGIINSRAADWLLVRRKLRRIAGALCPKLKQPAPFPHRLIAGHRAIN